MLYALLGLLGLALPYSQFVPWVAANGLNMTLFLEQLRANPISRFFGWDVIVSACVLFVFMRIEGRREPVRYAWLAVVGTMLVGVSFGLPLYLYLREDAKAG